MIGNSGFKNHLTACETKHKDTETETQTNPQNRTENGQNPEQTQTEQPPEEQDMPEHVDAEPVDTEKIVIIHDGKPKKTEQGETAADRFFNAVGRFLEDYGEVVGAMISPIAAAYAEAQQPPPPPQQQQITGEEW